MEILLFIAILPIYLIGHWIYHKDTRKEPTSLLKKLFIGGILSIFLTLLLTQILGSLFPFLKTDIETIITLNTVQIFLFSFFGIAVIEEFSKWIITYKIGYHNQEFDEIMDMIVYATFVALGFACLENILYVLTSGITVGIIRALSAVPGHACDGIVMGYYLGLAKQQDLQGNTKKHKKYMFLSYLIPVILHGFYDFFIFSHHLIFGLCFFITTIFYCIHIVKKIAKYPSFLQRKNKYCPNCGQPVTGNFCANCGQIQN